MDHGHGGAQVGQPLLHRLGHDPQTLGIDVEIIRRFGFGLEIHRPGLDLRRKCFSGCRRRGGFGRVAHGFTRGQVISRDDGRRPRRAFGFCRDLDRGFGLFDRAVTPEYLCVVV